MACIKVSKSKEALRIGFRLYVFQNLNTLDISEKGIDRLKASHKPKSDALTDKVRQHVLAMLNKISDRRINIIVPWSKIKRDGFTWWPAGIQVIRFIKC